MVGNFGGVLSAYIYLSKDAPRFVHGHAILIGTVGMSTLISAFMTLYYRRENARRDRVYKRPEEYSEEERVAEREKGDGASYFRYTV